MQRQFLILDADDTLWENNIYFEAAFERFCEYLDHSTLAPAQVRDVLDEIELVNAQIHGYGSMNFARNLAQCFRHLSERQISDADLDAVREFAYEILRAPMQLIDGVPETVAELSTRHDLTLFTKGAYDEQKMKIDQSELGCYFQHCAIVKEKNAAAYRSLAEERGFDLSRTWMIGNSPKSDVVPALEAGMGAVYVPHSRTWSLEKAEIPDAHPRLLRVESIRDLLKHF